MSSDRGRISDALPRAFGLWSLAAIGVNMVVGASFFLLPATYFGLIGAWSPWLLAAVGVCLLPIGFCFAEAGSRFDGTGGPYLYTRAAFGRFIGFEMGWLIWLMRVISHSSVLAALALSLEVFFPGLSGGWGKPVVILAVTAPLIALNIAGARPGAIFLDALTWLKFLPLVIFAALGLFYVEWDRLTQFPSVSLDKVSQAALFMAFSLGGFEMLTVPAGEARNPYRHVPRALVFVVLFTVALAVITNVVVIGALSNPAASVTPIADSAALLLGPIGAVIISLVVVVSVVGHNLGSIVVISRMLFSLAENGDIPRFFARVHGRFRTPHVSILTTGFVVALLACNDSFENLVAISAITRMFVYCGVALATLRLRSAEFDSSIGPRRYKPPLTVIMPWLALMVALFFLVNMTGKQLAVGAIGFLIGALLFAGGRLWTRLTTPL